VFVLSIETEHNSLNYIRQEFFSASFLKKEAEHYLRSQIQPFMFAVTIHFTEGIF